MSWIAAIPGIVAGVSQAVSGISSIFGGGSSGRKVVPPPVDQVLRMLRTAPPSEIARLDSAYRAANKGRPLPSDVSILIRDAAGGTDGKITTPEGEVLWAVFSELVTRYGVEAPSWSPPAPTPTPAPAPAPAPTASLAPTASAPTVWPTFPTFPVTDAPQTAPAPSQPSIPAWVWPVLIVGLFAALTRRR